MSVTLDQSLPAFQAQATSGLEVSPDSLRGRQTVLYFYPKDNTPGCTTQGQGFRDLHEQFVAANTQILGISRDSLRTHENFRAKQGFPFELISDKDETLCHLFEVLQPKKLYGKEYIGVDRSTFLIDRDGVVRKIWRNVKVPGHVDEVLAAAQALNEA
ncbi:peroxiredoxin [Pseudomonas oryzihabitans]|nr:peroxiredoxin [Pseudomonas psychrotolerans]KTT13151.1 peroxiredoxin [Pseudomonas psychrotolerans]KTT22073.1 peroxiredoxin [Pseudomonas psychrotolerans]KTT53119.1 peroxiredoxin [Pseudomonas psychrotolerans]KTT54845.1 peroxiredoxin [Pseudomonas psychrotolerans]